MMEMKWLGISKLFNRAHLPIGGDHPVRHTDRVVQIECMGGMVPNKNEWPPFEIAPGVAVTDASYLCTILTVVM